MTPLFFGATGRRLFGVYDAPRSVPVRRGVVICYPIGVEYYCAHRACSALARHLSAAGMDVLRFDYPGTGDSEGEVCDFVVDDWTAAVGQAVDELKDMTGLSKVALVGLRFGAALALDTARQRRDIERVALWDLTLEPQECVGDRDRDLFSAALVEGLAKLGADGFGDPGIRTLRVITEMDERGSATEAPAQEPAQSSPPTELRRCPGPRVWEEGEDFGTAGLPVQVMRTISDWLTQAA